MLRYVLMLMTFSFFSFANIPPLTTYTNKNQPQSETLPQGEQKSFSYDSFGKQTQITDYANKAIKFIYDSNDRLVRTEYADGTTTTYAYTVSGRVQQITDTQGSITNSYDSMGRLKTQTNPSGEVISYSYDGVGNIIEVVTPTQTITKSYDALNRLESVTDNQGTVTYNYDAIGRQTKVLYSNGVSTNYSYDSRNRIIKIEHLNALGITVPFVKTTEKYFLLVTTVSVVIHTAKLK